MHIPLASAFAAITNNKIQPLPVNDENDATRHELAASSSERDRQLSREKSDTYILLGVEENVSEMHNKGLREKIYHNNTPLT